MRCKHKSCQRKRPRRKDNGQEGHRHKERNNAIAMKKLGERYDLPVIVTSLIVVVAFVGLTLAMPDTMMSALQNARDWVEYNLGALIKLFTLVTIFYCAWVAFSKYGNIRLGKATPKYSTWIWIVLIFCSSFSMSIMFWAVLE